MVGNNKPNKYNHLFASIQSLNNQLDTLALSEDHFDYIVIGEVHHVSAKSYRAVLKHFSLQYFLLLNCILPLAMPMLVAPVISTI